MKPTPHQYSFVEFLADVRYIEELKLSWSWSSREELDVLIHGYFTELYAESAPGRAEWRYKKWTAVFNYVCLNIEAFNYGDLAVVNEQRALGHGKLFHPIFDYAIAHDISSAAELPDPRYFHKP
jgi:hypothetical protein